MTVDPNISSRINLMRILLISGILFVHVPHDPDTSPFLGLNGLFDWLRVFLGDSLFRIGVPCLSAISGYLLFQRGWETFNYSKTLRSKAKTVLLPFLLWNLGLLGAMFVIQRVDMGVGYFPDLWNISTRELLSNAFATEGLPINIPLYFLRDLIVCILLSPILAVLVRRFPAATLGVLFLLAITPMLTVGIVLKKSILFSFTLGIFLALYQVDLKSADRFAGPGTAVMLAAAVLLSIGLYWTGPDFPWPLDMARNALSILGAGGFWLMSAIIIRSWIGQRLAATGSLSFWMFCAHYPLLVLMWMVWNRVAGDDLYPLFYGVAAVASFVILVVSNRLVSHRMRGLYEVLTGSRGRKAKLLAATKSHPLAEASGPGEPAITQQHR
ncbi:Succinoglycan biosynthesis protein ExoH [Neorhizobium galegae bv. officinalis bv. officinalis str. HAMBI 1141]|uniref:Succinoglycan biosynthesis protein ExoH n=1 Tax=Neorhizobium galegae bv. officinalis bv. officinalis str. HAMBI 1141 TaxID=1028801 RepID=A0A068TAZ9_NEOGA|nr:Succinoglycan biosynthesis protein ExoH [Neorhizobium galegae bv. officinalis bv. officinalis str. HAMBI 1141]